MKKEIFVLLINALEKQCKEDEDTRKALSPVFSESTIIIHTKLITDIISVIDQSTNTDGWVDWWIWENDFGRKKLEVTENGKEVTIKTPGQLYDFITK